VFSPTYRTFHSQPLLRKGQDDAIDGDVISKASETAAPTPESIVQEVVAPVEEKIVGQSSKHDFQAETRKLLDIVAHSLYTDKEVFIRELISNSSDALEKLRHEQQVWGPENVSDPDLPLEINIYTDEVNNKLIIQDYGIGMTEAELITNLGTIAKSGTSEFLQKVEEGTSSTLIGQFGVGFYSTFMVAHTVKVFSKYGAKDSTGYRWSSAGAGTYDIVEAENVPRGTKIVIELNDSSVEFCKKATVEGIIKKYSNFVQYPIKLNGERLNRLRALWTVPKENITEEEHKEFYQFISHAYDKPRYKIQFATDSPLDIKALFYIPEEHSEKFGLSKSETSVSLYSRKVLIQNKASGILPEWLRFIKGVVDSEDIPLNLSREHLQDSALIRRINNVLTKKVLKFLETEAKLSAESYNSFYNEFGNFLKEGIYSDFKWKDELAPLLRFDSSKLQSGELTSFDDYIGRMKEGQNEIYYLVIPSRQLGEASPYYESFKKSDTEVLFMYTSIDDLVFTNLGEYQGKKLVSIETLKADSSSTSNTDSTNRLSDQECDQLSSWFRDVLKDQVSTVKPTNRLVDSPVMILDHESGTFRRMMRLMDPNKAQTLSKQQLHFNPSHPVIMQLNSIRKSKPDLSHLIAQQLFDNALIAAGLMDDSRIILPRVNKLIEQALRAQKE